MNHKEYLRLLRYQQARQLSQQHASRPAPTRRAAKSSHVGVALKNSHVVAMPTERLYISPNHYRSVNPEFNGARRAS